MHRGGCAFLPSVWMGQTFSVETEITRLLGFWFGFFFSLDHKKMAFFTSLKRRRFPWQLCPETPIPGLGSPSPGSWNSPVHPGSHSHWTVLCTLLGDPQRTAELGAFCPVATQ